MRAQFALWLNQLFPYFAPKNCQHDLNQRVQLFTRRTADDEEETQTLKCAWLFSVSPWLSFGVFRGTKVSYPPHTSGAIHFHIITSNYIEMSDKIINERIRQAQLYS